MRVEVGFESAATDAVVKWTDVSPDVTHVDVQRGRSKELDVIEAGEATIRLDNPDGVYTPGRAASPYAGKMKPRKPIRAYTVVDNNLLHFECVNSNSADLDNPRFTTYGHPDDRGASVRRTFDRTLEQEVFAFQPPGPDPNFINYVFGLPEDSDAVPVRAGDLVYVTAQFRNLIERDYFSLRLGFYDETSTGYLDVTRFSEQYGSDATEWQTATVALRAFTDGYVRVHLEHGSFNTEPAELLMANAKVTVNTDFPELVRHPASGMYPLFRGYVDTWATEYDGELAYAEIKAVDAMSLLSRPIRSFYRHQVHTWQARFLPSAGPTDTLHYWPCVTGADDVSAQPDIGTLPLTRAVTADPPSTGGFTDTKTMEHADGMTSGGFTVDDEDPAKGAVLRLNHHSAPVLLRDWVRPAAYWGVGFWYRGQLPAAGTRSCLFIAANAAGARLAGLWLNANGTVTAEWAGNGTGPDVSITSVDADAVRVRPDAPVWIGLTVDATDDGQSTATDVALNIGGVGVASTTTARYNPLPQPAFTAFGGRLYPGSSGEFIRGAIAHIVWATGRYVRDMYRLADELAGKVPTNEVERLGVQLDAAQWVGTRALDEPLSVLLPPRWDNGTDANGLLSDTANDAGGTFLIGAAGEAVYQNRYRRIGVPPRWQLREWATGLRFELDSSRVFNVVRAERATGLYREVSDPASIAEHGTKGLKVRRDVDNPDEVYAAAGWLLHRYRESSPRCDQLTIDSTALHSPDDGPLVALAHGAAVSDRIRLFGLPVSAPAAELAFYIEGIRTTIDIDGAQLRMSTVLQVSDASRSDAWVLEDATTGVLDADGCVAVY